MNQELTKTILAVSWHLGDVILDAMDAPKKARLTLAGIGIAWAGFFLIKELARETWHEADLELANRLRRK